MKDLVALCKRRGFIFQDSEIYGGLNGFWDYGPLGVELKNNLRDAWWKANVLCPPIGPDGQPVAMVGLDSTIINHPKTWEASGHLANFSDPMVDCRETKYRYRADHLKIYIPSDKTMPWFAFNQEAEEKDIQKKLRKIDIKTCRVTMLPELPLSDYAKIIGPDTDKPGTLTEPRQFNLMFETYVGAQQSATSKAYLRPETAQGIFLNFKNVCDSTRVKVPFGIAQIGKAFRNEVTPRNFIFRSREFEQMEIEFFCPPKEAKTWVDFWIAQRKKFWLSIGLKESMLQYRQHGEDELSHYAKGGYGTLDIEFMFPFSAPGFGELEGIAHRKDFDLSQHQKFSGLKLEYRDPETNETFIPHVIEPSAGLTRGVLALLCQAYTVDEKRPSGMYLDFSPKIAPKKAAILPLMSKGEQADYATKVYMDLREHFPVDLDIKQNIGKRYARQDEIGTPFCITVDSDTMTDNTVTVRHRNTMQQERVSTDKLRTFIQEKM